MYGAAITLLVAILGRLIYGLLRMNIVVKVRLPWRQWSRTVIASGVFLTVIFILKRALETNVYIEILFCLAAAGIAYLGALFLLKNVTPEELRLILARVFPNKNR